MRHLAFLDYSGAISLHVCCRRTAHRLPRAITHPSPVYFRPKSPAIHNLQLSDFLNIVKQFFQFWGPTEISNQKEEQHQNQNQDAAGEDKPSLTQSLLEFSWGCQLCKSPIFSFLNISVEQSSHSLECAAEIFQLLKHIPFLLDHHQLNGSTSGCCCLLFLLSGFSSASWSHNPGAPLQKVWPLKNFNVLPWHEQFAGGGQCLINTSRLELSWHYIL